MKTLTVIEPVDFMFYCLSLGQVTDTIHEYQTTHTTVHFEPKTGRLTSTPTCVNEYGSRYSGSGDCYEVYLPEQMHHLLPDVLLTEPNWEDF